MLISDKPITNNKPAVFNVQLRATKLPTDEKALKAIISQNIPRWGCHKRPSFTEATRLGGWLDSGERRLRCSSRCASLREPTLTK